MMEDRAPIVFFAYNRPEHTRRALESLCKCDGALESEFFIYCDGPKRSKDKKAVNRVREIAKSYNWCGAGSFLAKQLRRCER